MKRGILILVTAAMLSPVFIAPKIAEAAPDLGGNSWITVSSWAYNSVSNFKKAALLPESFAEVTDYTQNITRGQFAELVFSVQDRTENLKETKRSYLETRRKYTDTENEAAGYLGKLGIMEGEIVSTDFVDGMMHDNYAFYPERLLTREEMAAVVYRCMSRSCEQLIGEAKENKTNLKQPTDYKEISNWARNDVLILSGIGVIAGMEDGSFAPKQNLTIEQAVQVLYSYYNLLPTTDEADGANIKSDYEETVQTYPNGLTETKQGDVLYLKDGDNVLMSFETDIYSNVYSIDLGGVTYAAAVNVFGKTDLYNARTGELLVKIPRRTYKLTDDYILTKSPEYSAPTFGICAYDGTELLPPEYSLTELDEIKANNMQIPTEEYRASDGWIYYTGTEGGIYRIDTNGENKQKLSDNTTYQLTYVDGWLYYLANSKNVTTGISETKGYYCTKADGSEEYYITDNYIDFLGGGYVEYSVNDNGIGVNERLEYDFSDAANRYTSIGGFDILRPVLHIDGWIYYREEASNEQDGYYWKLSRMRVSNGAVQTEVVIDGHCINNVNYKDDKIYFSDSRKSRGAVKTSASDLYCYDNGKITLLCDKNIQDFGFCGDSLVLTIGDDYDNTKLYLADLDGGNLREAEDLNKAEERERNGEAEQARIDEEEDFIPEGGRRDRNFTVKGDGWITYLDYRNNVIRYDTETKTETEVYPCKGLHRYGKMRYLASKNDCMYKVDEDGNYTFLTGGCKPNYLFVADGAADGVQYLNYHDYF